MWLGTKLTALSDYLFRTFFRFLFRYDIFISYARRDGKDYALKLRDQLRQLDFSCFLDFDELPAGNSLNKTLRRALRRSAALVLVGTERAVSSRYVELEVGEFAQTGRAIIPIDIEGSLGAAPWPVVRERDLVWIDEARAALARGVPSPQVADQIDKLFKYTRRNSRVRAQVLATIGLFVVIVAASLFLIRQQVNAATTAAAEADRQRGEAVRQKDAADNATAVAETRRLDAQRATDEARKAQHDAEVALGKAATAETKANEAAAEARRQEQAALRNAERARAEQKRAAREQERAEERTRYVQAQQAGVQADLAYVAGDDLERSALLAVESLRRSLTPEGYAAWARAMDVLPRPRASGFPGAGGDNVTALAYSPDGRWLAEGSGDGRLVLRRAGADSPVEKRLPVDGEVVNIAFARDGTWVAAASQQGFARWELPSLREQKTLKSLNGEGVVISPDGRHLAVTGPGHVPRLRIFDLGAAGPDEPVFDHTIKDVRYAMSVAYSDDGRWLAVACEPGSFHVWNTGQLAAAPRVYKLPGNDNDDEVIRHIAFAPGEPYLLGTYSTARGGLLVKAWELPLNDENSPAKDVFEVRAPRGDDVDLRTWALAFSPDREYVAVAAKDKTARVWELGSRREAAWIESERDVRAVVFSPDGRALATTTGGGVEFWETTFGPAPLRLAHDGEVNSLTLSPGGESLVTAGAGGVRVFRAGDWSPVAALAETGPTSDLSFSPDGRLLVVAGGGRAAVFDARTWKRERVLGEVARGSRVAFSPDGCWLVVTTETLVRLYEYGTWREARTFPHGYDVGEVSFSADGARLSAVSSSPHERYYRQTHRTYVWGVADGRLVACGARTDEYPLTGKVREPAPGTEAVACAERTGHAQESLLAETEGWSKTRTFVHRAAASPDGRWQMTDGKLMYKEGNAARELAGPPASRGEEHWTFTPDGRWLVAANGRVVTPWPLTPPDMIKYACARLRRRDLTQEEWQTFFSGEKPGATCGS